MARVFLPRAQWRNTNVECSESVNLVPLLSRGVVQKVMASAIGFDVGVSPVVWS